MIIKVNNINLYYEMIGRGEPLIMVHGNGETHEIFQEAVEVLSKHFTCYLIDSRGHGQSEPVKEFHYEDMAGDMYQLIKELKLQNVTYYGFSDGGIIGIILAAKHPDLLKRMIISGANTNPKGMKWYFVWYFSVLNKFRKDPLVDLMLKEPYITKEQLQKITVPTLVLAGSKDCVKEEDTKFIASSIPNARLKILEGEKHETYIVHSVKIAELILGYK